VLLNFFASWCLPCAQEAPVLARLRQGGATIWGIAYRDKPDAAAAFLQRHGDPFARVALDDAGAAGIAFDVSGVPETYLVDPRGIVRWSWAGGLSVDIANRSLIPLLHSTLA
jgi:cytochrome c biogenesis protein CcmG/thiol:disulfide interchange protein DsbE